MTGIFLKKTSALLFTGKYIERKKQVLYLSFLFITAFFLRLLIFFNTTIFEFSDFVIYYNFVFYILNGENLPLFNNFSPLVISHIGAWFIKYFCSLNYWFYSNIIISCVSILLLWLIVKKVTLHSGIANVTALFLIFYPAFAIQPSVFYTQIVMMFLASCIFILVLKSFETSSKIKIILYVVIGSCIQVLTLFFKWELLYLYIFIGFASVPLFFFKFRKQAYISLLFGLVALVFMQLTINFFPPVQTYIKNGTNGLLFFGQTYYGEGEGMMLDKYAGKYYKGLEKFKKQHKGEFENNLKEENAYRKMLIINFFLNHPDQWAALQIKKFFRTLGVKPEGVSFRVLVSGRLPINIYLAGILISTPYIILFLTCIRLFDWRLLKKLLGSYAGIFMAVLLVYYIIATIFYPHYQIRYRMPLEFFFLAPATAAFLISALTKGNSIKSVIKKHFKWKVIVFLIFLSAWAYEVYDITYLNSDRYIKNAEEFEKGNIP